MSAVSRNGRCCLLYTSGLHGLPKSDVLKYLLDGNCSVVVRPSGTEPKMKVYVSVTEENEEKARKVEEEIVGGVEGSF